MMRGIELVTLSVLLLTAQQLTSANAAPSSVGYTLTPFLDEALAAATSSSAANAVEMQLKTALDAAGCSKSAVDQLKVSSERECSFFIQATLNYQQMAMNCYYFFNTIVNNFKIYTDFSCFKDGQNYLQNLECYVDNVNKTSTLEFETFRVMAFSISQGIDNLYTGYEQCFNPKSSVTYAVGEEKFVALEPLVQKHCPAGTSIDTVKAFESAISPVDTLQTLT